MDIRRSIINALAAFFGGGEDGSPPLTAQCLDVTIPAGTTYYVSSGDVWGVLALAVEVGAELRIDGEVHAWGDVTGGDIYCPYCGAGPFDTLADANAHIAAAHPGEPLLIPGIITGEGELRLH